MKKILSLLSAMLVFHSLVMAQWDVIHQSGATSGHADLFFLNADTGYVLGAMTPPDAYVLRTMNGGATWDSVFFEGFSVRSMHFPSNDTGYISGFTGAGANLSVMRTINSGDSWEVIATDLHIGNFHAIPICFVDNNTGFISHPAFFARTEDAGLTWNPLTSFEGAPPDLQVEENLLVGGFGAVLIYSLDLGQSFNSIILGYAGGFGAHYNLNLYGEHFLSCAGGSNGTSLGFETYGFGIVTFGSVVEETYITNYFPSRNRVWDVAWPGDDIMYGISTSIYLGDDYPHFFIKSIDGGLTWHEQGTPEYGYPGTNKLACPTEEVCYAVGGTGGKIYKTSNGGGPLLDPLDQVVLSTEDRSEGSAISLHPNPAHTYATLSSAQQPIVRLAVCDLQGRLVHEAEPGATSYRIPLAGLPAGMYVVRVQVGGEVLRKKLVVE